MTREERSLADVVAASELSGPWNELAARLPGTGFFHTHDWLVAWWETIGGRPEGSVGLWWESDDRLAAAVPLAKTSPRLHPRLPIELPTWTTAGAGIGSADHVDWLASPTTREAVSAWAATVTDGAAWLLESVPDAAGWMVPPSARRLETTACPRVVLDGSPIGSSKLRKQLRQYERKLADAGVEFIWHRPGSLTTDLLDPLFALHDVRSDMAERTTTFNRTKRAFHARLIELGDESRGPAALVAEVDGLPVGILYGFWWQSSFAYYQSGWDPEFAQWSLGTVLVARAIEAASDHGAQLFDLLRGAEPYKYRMGAVDAVDHTWLVPSGWSGRALQLKHWAKDRTKERMAPTGRGAEGI